MVTRRVRLWSCFGWRPRGEPSESERGDVGDHHGDDHQRHHGQTLREQQRGRHDGGQRQFQHRYGHRADPDGESRGAPQAVQVGEREATGRTHEHGREHRAAFIVRRRGRGLRYSP